MKNASRNNVPPPGKFRQGDSFYGFQQQPQQQQQKPTEHPIAIPAILAVLAAAASGAVWTNYADKGNDFTHVLNIAGGDDPVMGALLSAIAVLFAAAAYHGYWAKHAKEDQLLHFICNNEDGFELRYYDALKHHDIRAPQFINVGLFAISALSFYAIALGAASVAGADNDWVSQDLVNGTSSDMEQGLYFAAYATVFAMAMTALFFRKPLMEKATACFAGFSGQSRSSQNNQSYTKLSDNQNQNQNQIRNS